MTDYDQFLADHIARRAAEAGLSVDEYKRRQTQVLLEDLRRMPLHDDCQACGNTGFIGRFGEMRCPECD